MKSLATHINESLQPAPYTYTKSFDGILGSLYTLRFNTQYVHWNYKGQNFIEVHRYLDEIVDAIDSYIDKLAENIRTKDIKVKNPFFNVDTECLITQQIEMLGLNQVVETFLKCLDSTCNDISTLLASIGTDSAPDMLFDKANEDILISMKKEFDQFKWQLKQTFS